MQITFMWEPTTTSGEIPPGLLVIKYCCLVVWHKLKMTNYFLKKIPPGLLVIKYCCFAQIESDKLLKRYLWGVSNCCVVVVLLFYTN